MPRCMQAGYFGFPSWPVVAVGLQLADATRSLVAFSADLGSSKARCRPTQRSTAIRERERPAEGGLQHLETSRQSLGHLSAQQAAASE